MPYMRQWKVVLADGSVEVCGAHSNSIDFLGRECLFASAMVALRIRPLAYPNKLAPWEVCGRGPYLGVIMKDEDVPNISGSRHEGGSAGVVVNAGRSTC